MTLVNCVKISGQPVDTAALDNMAVVAQMVRALGCGPRGHGFDARRSPQKGNKMVLPNVVSASFKRQSRNLQMGDTIELPNRLKYGSGTQWLVSDDGLSILLHKDFDVDVRRKMYRFQVFINGILLDKEDVDYERLSDYGHLFFTRMHLRVGDVIQVWAYRR